jgi:hypothetical protein
MRYLGVMLNIFNKAILSAAAVLAIAPAAASAYPVDITGFSLSPSCTHPSGTVTANISVVNATLQTQRFYARTTTSYFGAPVMQSDIYGPYDVPPIAQLSTSISQQVPWYAPNGMYTVVLGIGPSTADPTSWSTRNANLWVAPQGVC